MAPQPPQTALQGAAVAAWGPLSQAGAAGESPGERRIFRCQGARKAYMTVLIAGELD